MAGGSSQASRRRASTVRESTSRQLHVRDLADGIGVKANPYCGQILVEVTL
jgi:hypothetical protein